MESQERNMPFIKNLASSDRKLRTKSLESLRNFLSARQVASSLSTLDILKLWKGLFYALWMCDRPLPQQALAQDLADLIYVLPENNNKTEVVETWLRGFWATMAREWTGIDVLRLEKFLLLVRRVLGASLAWMKVREQEGEGKDGGKKRKSSGKEKKQKGKWDAKKVDAVVGVLADYPFVLEEDAQPRKLDGEEADEEEEEEKDEAEVKLTPAFVPVGLKLHVLDIWVDEAEKVGLLEDEDEEAKDIVRRITEIVDGLEKSTVSPGVRIRAKQSLLDDRLPFTNIAGSDAGSE
ncbi:nucleolar protein,Nop52-domain-containing protein [Coniochaeta sp. 2T2.1]|nr:nucleolar protein,Nop52-domain-containing protein [Coniochaeta sp. 2T2.1]